MSEATALDHDLRLLVREPVAGAPLPAPSSPLLGRERDLGHARTLLLREDVRLITVTGPPGVGKTRLAVEAARRAGDEFADGVAFVDLAPVADPERALVAVAAALGVRGAGEGDLDERIALFLLDAEILLVLDNFEQVVDAAPRLAKLLAECSGVKVLASSRERLHLAGEHELPLAPLELPAPETEARALADVPAVALFCARAQAVRPDFALTDENGPGVAELCRRLDGLPLAIELAAARVKLLSPDALLARLGRRLELLRGRARDVPARHRTLREAIAWSYVSLPRDEQAVFRRLSVLAGGGTLEAAEAIGDARGDVADPLATIASLVDKSLLGADQDGEPRVRMLETVRDYARDQLRRSGEEDEVLGAHATHFATLAQAAGSWFASAGRGEQLDMLERELANLDAALEFLLAHDPDAALRLAGSVAPVWYERGAVGERRRRLERALDAAQGGDAAARGNALLWASRLAHEDVDPETAAALAAEALTLFRAHGDDAGAAAALQRVAVVASVSGDGESARSAYGEALSIARALGDRRLTASTLSSLGRCLWEAERFGEATRCLEESIALYRELGAPERAAFALAHLGGVARERGDRRAALPLLEEAGAVLSRSRSAGDRLYGIASLAEAAELRGDRATALALRLDGLEICRRSGFRMALAWGLVELGAFLADDGGAEEAVWLIGAGAAAIERSRRPMWRDMQLAHDRGIRVARRTLGAERVAAALRRGSLLTLEVAYEEAQRASARRGRDSVLTQRELDVLLLVAEGVTNAEIAARLVVSVRTVHAHLRSIYRKLDVRTRTAAARRGAELELLPREAMT